MPTPTPTAVPVLAATYRAVSEGRKGQLMRELFGPLPPSDPDALAQVPSIPSGTSARLTDMLNALEPERRLAIQLFVVEELPAAEVARIVGWPNAKAVYNRVYRALAALRAELERQGIGPDDL